MSTQSLEKTRLSELDILTSRTEPFPLHSAQSFTFSPELAHEHGLALCDQKPFQWFLKRTLDITASALGILGLSPLLLLVALAIHLESKGPVLYMQKRVGLKGKLFKMYKFRSMHPNADDLLEQLLDQNQTNKGMFKLFNDPRVTKVGRFIRKYSIDELPQLLNVLKGDMSLVGPRPPIDRELKHYERWHYLRFNTLPGLTGIWQVSGRSRIQEFDTVVSMDFRYIREWNIMLDLKLLLKTIPVVLGGMDTA